MIENNKKITEPEPEDENDAEATDTDNADDVEELANTKTIYDGNDLTTQIKIKDNAKYETIVENLKSAHTTMERLNTKGHDTAFQNGVDSGAYQIWQKSSEETQSMHSTSRQFGDDYFTRKTFDAITTGTSRYYTENDAAAQAKYDTAMAKVSALDTKLENRLNQVETQKKAVEQEMESVDSIIKSNIERTFKYFG